MQWWSVQSWAKGYVANEIWNLRGALCGRAGVERRRRHALSTEELAADAILSADRRFLADRNGAGLAPGGDAGPAASGRRSAVVTGRPLSEGPKELA